MYGSDTSTMMGGTGDDLDTTGSELDDAGVIGQDMVRALTTRAGALPWAPADTLDVNGYLGRTGSDADRAALARQIEDVFARDERYASVTATVAVVNERLAISVSAVTDVGAFELQLEQDGDAMRVIKLG